MGLLRLRGTVEVKQFWPMGTADADTSKIIVSVDTDAFSFREKDNGPFRTTHAFDDATVKGKQVVANGKVTVRLQGIDAPELHYRASPLSPKERNGASAAKLAKYKEVNHEYRQFLAESAAAAMGRMLGKPGDALDCEVESIVSKPNDVFDMYGRMVGDVVVKRGAKKVNLNRWAVSEGWAFPAFYNSMTEEEIEALIAAAQKGRKKGRVWDGYDGRIAKFAPKVVYRRPKQGVVLEPDTKPAQGKVAFPKLFRRQTTWFARNASGIFTGDFVDYLASARDDFYLREDFLSDGETAAPVQHFHESIEKGRLTLDPEDYVFREGASTLLRNGKPVLTW